MAWIVCKERGKKKWLVVDFVSVSTKLKMMKELLAVIQETFRKV